MSAFIEDLSEKTALVDNDLGVIADSAASNQNKKVKLSSLWTYIKNKLFLYTTTKTSGWTAYAWYKIAYIAPGVASEFSFEVYSGNSYFKGECAIDVDRVNPSLVILSKSNLHSATNRIYVVKLNKIATGAVYLEVCCTSANAMSAYAKFTPSDRNGFSVQNFGAGSTGTVIAQLNLSQSGSGIQANKIYAGDFPVLDATYSPSELSLFNGSFQIWDSDGMFEVLRLLDNRDISSLQPILSANLDLGGSDDNTSTDKNRSILWQGSGNTTNATKAHIIGDSNTISDLTTQKIKIVGDNNAIANSNQIDLVGAGNTVSENSSRTRITGQTNSAARAVNSTVSGKGNRADYVTEVSVHGKEAQVTMNSGRAFNQANDSYPTNCQQYQMSFRFDRTLTGNNGQLLHISIADNPNGMDYITFLTRDNIVGIDIKAALILLDDSGNLIESSHIHSSGILDLTECLASFTPIDHTTSLSSFPFCRSGYMRFSITDWSADSIRLSLDLFNVQGYGNDCGIYLSNYILRGNFWIDIYEMPINNSRKYVSK
jgi:hypothetical protein